MSPRRFIGILVVVGLILMWVLVLPAGAHMDRAVSRSPNFEAAIASGEILSNGTQLRVSMAALAPGMLPASPDNAPLGAFQLQAQATSTKTATDINGGGLNVGDIIQYVINITNIGLGPLQDRTGPEFVDPIPPNTTYVTGTATATTGTALFNAGLNQIEWNGQLNPTGESGDSVTIRFQVRLSECEETDNVVRNQGTVFFDSQSIQTDDPGAAGSTDSTDLVCQPPPPPPPPVITMTEGGLIALAAVLGLVLLGGLYATRRSTATPQ